MGGECAPGPDTEPRCLFKRELGAGGQAWGLLFSETKLCKELLRDDTQGGKY